MGEIRIKAKDKWNFNYDTDDHIAHVYSTRKCDYCNTVDLDSVYCYIIDSLKEAGLLDKDYKEICCYCYILKRFGILDVIEMLSSVRYYTSEDILVLEISFCTEDDRLGMWQSVKFNIHEYSKWA